MASAGLGAVVAAALGERVRSVTPGGGGCLSDARGVERRRHQAIVEPGGGAVAEVGSQRLVQRPDDLAGDEDDGDAQQGGQLLPQLGHREADERQQREQRDGRDAELQKAKDLAKEDAVKAGADPETVEIVEVDEIPLSYLPGIAIRVRAKAVGRLRL